MNQREHEELQILRIRQTALQTQLSRLTVDIEKLASRLNAAVEPVLEISPLEIPPLQEQTISLAQESNFSEQNAQTTSLPPPLPVEVTTAQVSAGDFQEKPSTFESTIPPNVRSAPSIRPETFEMKLGTYWLVRIGIVMLLTGLVFLGTYAYKNYVGRLEAPGKVALLYTASAALLGFGGWLQRKKVKEALRNYGQVLFAGGLAAVYFTTYAAHHIDALRIIASPLLDGFLLLLWAATTVWIADRRKSEVLALFAVGLAYYTSAITDVGLFTLGSNLVLTAAAVFFLIRNRWTTLSFISVLATYGGFAFWRFHQGAWGWQARITELWPANFYLSGYWLFFTAAVFFARGKSLANASRALFASLNNGAFFGLVLLSMAHMHEGKFWIFSLSFGSTLLGAALLARRFLAAETVVKNTYLVQGLTLITLGVIDYFTGLQLALMLAAESVVLAFLGHQQKNIFVRAGSYITGFLSAACVLLTNWNSRDHVTIGVIIGMAFLLNAWCEQRNDLKAGNSLVRPFSGYFVTLAVGVFGIVTWHAVPENWRAVAWMLEAITLTVLFYALRIPSLSVFSQALALASQVYWFFEIALRQTTSGWAVPVTFIGGTLALTFLGHHQKNVFVRASAYFTAGVSVAWVLTTMTATRLHLSLGAAMSVAFLLGGWWENRHDAKRSASVVRPCSGYFIALAILVCAAVTWHAVPTEWRAVAWMLEALGLTMLYYAVRIPELPLFSQALTITAQGFWFFEFALRQSKPHWLVPATLVGGTLALSHWWQRQRRLALVNDLRNVLQIVYAFALVGVLFFWFKPAYAPAAWLAFLSMLAIGLTLYGVATRAWALAACAQLFLLISSLELFQQFAGQKPDWQFALVPIATWLVLGVATTAWLSRHDTREQVRRPLLQVSLFYRGVAFLMSLWWIYTYVPVPHQFWVLCAVGIALVALAGWRKNQEALLFSGSFFVVGFAAWFTRIFVELQVVNWPNALTMLSLFATQQVLRRLPERFNLPKHTDSAVILITGVALWTFVSRWMVWTSGARFLLTVSWAGLAAILFTMGFLLRERVHRWLGLGILACAIARVFFSDVWKLDTIYRILSFMALGVVLLALGFIYNKYQEKIRQWL